MSPDPIVARPERDAILSVAFTAVEALEQISECCAVFAARAMATELQGDDFIAWLRHVGHACTDD